MTIGGNIKRIRAEKRISQKELADRLNTTTQNISQYESNKRKPKMETLEKFADALGVTVYDLVVNTKGFYFDDICSYYMTGGVTYNLGDSPSMRRVQKVICSHPSPVFQDVIIENDDTNHVANKIKESEIIAVSEFLDSMLTIDLQYDEKTGCLVYSENGEKYLLDRNQIELVKTLSIENMKANIKAVGSKKTE